jgi:hypothetical protein
MSTTKQKIKTLKNNYNKQVSSLVNNANKLIRNIMNNRRLNNNTKIIQINSIKQQFNNKVQSLNKILYNNYLLCCNPVPIQNIKNKKALLIGINYINSDYELRGCINDIINIKNKLVNSFSFNTTNVTTICDDINIIPNSKIPTKSVILEEFKNFLSSGEAGDLLFFQYSGHGSNIIDRSADEIDGIDETIVSSDMQMVSDDELRALINTYLKPNVSLIALFDSCHSGTILDLKYQYFDSSDYNNFTDNDKTTETNGNVIMISGCMDSQTSADAFIEQKSQGAMTWAFLNTINYNPKLTWSGLLQNMRNLLRQNNYEQIPQCSSGKLIRIDSPFVL